MTEVLEHRKPARMRKIATDKGAMRWLAGRRIVRVEMHPFPDGRGRDSPLPRGQATAPCFFLDDGQVVTFYTQETEVGEYGTGISVHAR